MKRPKSELVKTAGTVFELVKAIADEVMEQGGDDSDVRLILSDPKLRKQIGSTIVAVRSLDEEVYDLRIDYAYTLDQMISHGNLVWSNPDIMSKNFQIGTPEIMKTKSQLSFKLRLVRSNPKDTNGSATEHIKALGLIPAGVEHLAALAFRFPDVSWKFRVIALGSGWHSPQHNGRMVPYLHEHQLGLTWGEGHTPVKEHGKLLRFLAVEM